MFYGRDGNASCCGNQDNTQSGTNSKRILVTYEALNLTVTSTVLTQLQHSTSYYTNENTNSGPSLLEFNGGISVGDVVNIYMVYLNDNTNRRSSSNYGEVTFEGDIKAVGFDWRHSLYFTGTRFSSSDYPRIIDASNEGKFKDRKFEPTSYNSGVFQNNWDNSGTSKDWFQVCESGGNVRSPNYNGNPLKKFRMGCKNGAKGDFFRIITTVACSEPTGAGSIGNPKVDVEVLILPL